MKSNGSATRRKGDRIERAIVDKHRAIGIHAERYPLSGSTRFRGSGHDTDVYAFGRDEAPLVAEVKGRKLARGFVTIERWLGEYDILFLKRNNGDPLVVLPWRVWERLLTNAQPVVVESYNPAAHGVSGGKAADAGRHDESVKPG